MPGHRYWTMTFLVAVSLPLVLSGCNNTGRGYSSGGGYDDSSPSLNTLNQSQRRALKQGCTDRYGDNRRKYEQCVSGYRHSDDALIQGCYSRYKGNDRKLKRCLDGL